MPDCASVAKLEASVKALVAVAMLGFVSVAQAQSQRAPSMDDLSMQAHINSLATTLVAAFHCGLEGHSATEDAVSSARRAFVDRLRVVPASRFTRLLRDQLIVERANSPAFCNRDVLNLTMSRLRELTAYADRK